MHNTEQGEGPTQREYSRAEAVVRVALKRGLNGLCSRGVAFRLR